MWEETEDHILSEYRMMLGHEEVASRTSVSATDRIVFFDYLDLYHMSFDSGERRCELMRLNRRFDRARGRGIGVLFPNNQCQHCTLLIQEDVLPCALC